MLPLRRTLLSFSALFLLSHAPITFALPHNGFASSEHITAGDSIKLSFAPNEPGQAGHIFHLSNGLNVTYGDILALGDFYGLPDQPISYGETDSERASRFLSAFNSFASISNAVSEAEQIVAIMHTEKKLIEDAIKNGENPAEVHDKISMENSRQYNCITGGSCSSTTWWLTPGRYLNLLSSNYDHFGSNAWLAYQTGHHLAIEQARLAHQHHDVKRLELAYAMNAFACHFLSDRLAAGHIRTPREELPGHVTPAVVGSLLSGIMHNEESKNGLHVHNRRGDHWVTYGDGHYFDADNKTNRALHEEMLQASANEVYAAFITGEPQNNTGIYDIIPEPDEIADNSKIDLSPLFYWDKDSQQLMRRQDLTNLFDRHWTADWWGWSTLVALSKDQVLTPLDQAMLVSAGYGEKALADGLITDKNIVRYVKTSLHKVN